MNKAIKVSMLLLVMLLFWGLTVNPPQDLKRQTDFGDPVDTPVNPPPVYVPEAEPQAPPPHIQKGLQTKPTMPVPEMTVPQPTPEETPQKPKKKFPYIIILKIIGGLILLGLLGLLGYFIYQKLIPDF